MNKCHFDEGTISHANFNVNALISQTLSDDLWTYFGNLSLCLLVGAPRGENVYFFSGSWEALVIILGELWSKLIVLEIPAKKQKKKKKKKIKEKSPFRLFFF